MNHLNSFEACLLKLNQVELSSFQCVWYVDSDTTHHIHSYDILGAGMLWKPEEARILKNFINQRVNIW
jgi:hypothetical protein